jgi:hypothetical protein
VAEEDHQDDDVSSPTPDDAQTEHTNGDAGTAEPQAQGQEDQSKPALRPAIGIQRMSS